MLCLLVANWYILRSLLTYRIDSSILYIRMTDLHMQKTRQRRDTALRKRWKASPILYVHAFGGISGKTP